MTERIAIHAGDCLAVLADMGENSVDAVVCDPPYHLTSIVKRFGKPGSAPAQYGTDGAFARASCGFMGKEWVGGDIERRIEHSLRSQPAAGSGGSGMPTAPTREGPGIMAFD